VLARPPPVPSTVLLRPRPLPCSVT
jgi:hypothetical protein